MWRTCSRAPPGASCPVPHVRAARLRHGAHVNQQKRTARVVVQRCAEVRLVPRMLLMLRLVPFMLMLLLSVVLRVLLSVLLVRVLVCRGRRQAPQPEE